MLSKQNNWRWRWFVITTIVMATHVVGNCLLSQQKDSRSLVRSPDLDPELDPDLDSNPDCWSGA